jgi:hypothetical protein
LFEDTETIREEQKPAEIAWIICSILNNDCLAQDRPGELKLLSLEPSGNEDSENVFTIFLACL